MNKLQVLQSEQDPSVNFVEDQLAGFLESRYIRRCADYFVCYLSSHNGCNRGCAFCHLTATGQTDFSSATSNDFVRQALAVFRHYKTQPRAKYVHFSFMARGEPLANKALLDHGPAVLSRLGQLAQDEDLPAKFCVSTIMPRTLSKPLHEVFGYFSPTIYYSLYSVDEAFRQRWLPTAKPVEESLRLLADYQRFAKKIIKIHFAFIDGQNDSEGQVCRMCDALDDAGLICEFNLVRYNPATPAQGRESPPEILAARLAYITSRFKGRVKAVERVGFDVKASCGMFVEGQ